jgi:hypothetical protein
LRIRSRADQIPGAAAGDLAVSGLTGQGLDALRLEVARRLFGGTTLPLETTPFTARQVEALAEVLARRARREPEGPAWAALVAGGEEFACGDT